MRHVSVERIGMEDFCCLVVEAGYRAVDELVQAPLVDQMVLIHGRE